MGEDGYKVIVKFFDEVVYEHTAKTEQFAFEETHEFLAAKMRQLLNPEGNLDGR